jgi:hypothetical protein
MRTLPLKYFFFILCFVLVTNNCTWSQKKKEPAKKPAQQYADDFLIGKNTTRAKVLLLGVWHFDYPNRDIHQIDSSNMVDVLTPERQKEMDQVIDLLKKYQPTKICVESQRPGRIDSLYNAYLSGDYILTRNEVDQIGFRLAMQLSHKKVYAVDANSYADDYEDKYPEIEKLWSKEFSADPQSALRWDTSFASWYNYQDEMLAHCTILEKLTYVNDPRNVLRMYGNYVVGGFNTTNNFGPDKLALWWYDRNLRIFNNILNTKPAPEDRILVIFGSGHQPILQHCFEASPQFELVPFSDLFKMKD